MMPCWGLNRGYTQWVIGVCRHDQWYAPAEILKAQWGLFDGPVFMGWWPGMLFSHKVGAKTFFDGNPAVQQGHDPGYLIPHVAPPNYMIPVNMLTSKHKVEVPVTSVLIEGKFMGTYAFYMLLGLICSQPVSLPTGIVLHFAGTVKSDLTLEDLIMGLIFTLTDMIIDAIWALIVKGDKVWGLKLKRFDKGFPKWFKGRLDKIFNKTIVERLFPKGTALPGRFKMAWKLSPYVLRNMGSKALDHFGKTWVVSPLLQGALFQGTEFFDGFPRTALPSLAVGRSRIQFSFFPKLGYRVGNVTN